MICHDIVFSSTILEMVEGDAVLENGPFGHNFGLRISTFVGRSM